MDINNLNPKQSLVIGFSFALGIVLLFWFIFYAQNNPILSSRPALDIYVILGGIVFFLFIFLLLKSIPRQFYTPALVKPTQDLVPFEFLVSKKQIISDYFRQIKSRLPIILAMFLAYSLPLILRGKIELVVSISVLAVILGLLITVIRLIFESSYKIRIDNLGITRTLGGKQKLVRYEDIIGVYPRQGHLSVFRIRPKKFLSFSWPTFSFYVPEEISEEVNKRIKIV